MCSGTSAQRRARVRAGQRRTSPRHVASSGTDSGDAVSTTAAFDRYPSHASADARSNVRSLASTASAYLGCASTSRHSMRQHQLEPALWLLRQTRYHTTWRKTSRYPLEPASAPPPSSLASFLESHDTRLTGGGTHLRRIVPGRLESKKGCTVNWLDDHYQGARNLGTGHHSTVHTHFVRPAAHFNRRPSSRGE